MPEKQVSAAVIFIDLESEDIFGVHSTQVWPRKSHKDKGPWGLPKGLIDEGEDAEMAACREVKEECGFEPDPSKIKYAGKFDYLPVKDLEVFVCPVSSAEMKSMIEIAKCNSYFTNPSGVEQPEVDDYKVCKIDDFNLNYQRVIKNALSGVTY